MSAVRAFHVMSKPTGAICNLDCEYCFFLSKESLYPGSDFRMSDEVLDAYLRQLLSAHADAPEVVVAFQGGEPTMMGLPFFEHVLELERRYTRPGQQILNTVQTNATLIDEQWARFFADHEFLVGVSIDGPRELHDAYRVDKGGKPTYDRVLRGLRFLQSAGVEWNALTTINSANAGMGLPVYQFLRDELGATHIQFIPIVEREGEGLSRRTPTAQAFGTFMIDIFDEWVQHDVGDVFVQHFDTALARWLGLDDVGLCVHQRTCGASLALEHNGDLYSCDHFVDPEYLLGNITDGHTMLDLVQSPAQVGFGQAKSDGLPDYCRRCSVRFACNGGCPKDRFTRTPEGHPGLNYLCEGYREFFSHIDLPMRRMAVLVRSGRSAVEIRSPAHASQVEGHRYISVDPSSTPHPRHTDVEPLIGRNHV